MNSRDQNSGIESICDESIALLKRINLARHEGSSGMIEQIIVDFEGIRNKNINKQENITMHIKNIYHLMDFEKDPGFSAEEKLIFSTALKSIELLKISQKLENNSDNGIFKGNASTLQVEAAFLINSLKDTDKLAMAKQTVDARLASAEASVNEDVLKILEIPRPKPYAQPKSKAENKSEIRARVTLGSQIVKEKLKQKAGEKVISDGKANAPDASRAKISNQNVFAKRKPLASPRSIDPENHSKGNDSKRKKNG